MHKRLGFETLESRELLAADLRITEFMASNGGVLEDGDGAASDWIEIFNNGDQSVDLLGYSLTDDPGDLNQWSFSTSQVLAPGEFLVVFASGNDEIDSAGHIHTSFGLSSDGEYLALVDPLGTVLSEFGPNGTEYPPQVSDVSYGLAFDSTPQDVVTPASSVRYLVPRSSSVDDVWTDPVFNDDSWESGVASLGYESSGTNYTDAGLLDTVLPAGTGGVYVRIPFTISNSATVLNKLQMMYDDGFVAYINGTRVASANAPETVAYDSLATVDHPDASAMQYVDFDVSDYSNLLNVGENVLAIHMLNKSSTSSDMLAAINLQAITGGVHQPETIGQLLEPTPGLPNTNLRASDVVFSQTGGVYVSSFQLSLSTSDNTEIIRYTTDGSVPTESSQLYTSPLTISSTIQIRARAFGVEGQLGSVHSESYTRTDATTSAFTSDLPIVVLENFRNGTPGTGDLEDAVLSLYEIDEVTGRASLSSDADLSTIIGQHRRGKSTAGNPKTNLRIEIRDENGEDKNVELLGMPSESDWILYAPYAFDRAMLRNVTFYELSRAMGKWAPRTQFVEVYANFDDGELNEGDYMGVYVLMENLKRDDNRVDIAELTESQNSEPDITGGYIIAFDTPNSDTPADAIWETDRHIPTLPDSAFVFEEPEYDELTEAQIDYIQGYVQDFEDALYGPNSTDPELGYQAYFDVDSSIDHHLLRILAKEPDSLRLSTYLTKDRGGKLAFGPVWDFDRSAGPDLDSRAANPEGWYLPDVDFFESDWWGPLFDDPNFAQRWVDRWQELREGVLSDDNISDMVNGFAAQIAEGQVRNFEEWPEVAPNGGQYADPGLTGWEGEVSHLVNWLLIRANWIDAQLITSPIFSPTPGNVDSGQLVTLTADPGTTIYYTLDGTDPRADGGGISPTAMEYTEPIAVTSTTQINARASGSIEGSSISNSSYPGGESPSNAVDSIFYTKYLNYGGRNSGIIVTPDSGASIVQSFQLTTGNDFESRDPASWVLYGTNDMVQSTDNSTGLAENWTLIDSGDISLPSRRRSMSDVIEVANSTSYTSYKLMFPTLKDNYGFMQVADIRFFESADGSGAQILSPDDTALAVHVLLEDADALPPWSSLLTGLFSVEQPASPSSLRISELHYHPADPTTAELELVPGTDEDDFEFIELVNISSEFISLNGVQLSGGIDFDFTTADVTSLAPGQTVVVVKNSAAFTTRYGTDIAIAGEYSGKLADGGEQLALMDSNSQTIHDFTYDDTSPWATEADGDGPSLEVIDLFGDYSTANNWRVSYADGGSPGVYVTLPGDYDGNGIVEQADYLRWKSTFGSTTILSADGNHDGTVDLADFVVWRNHLGATLDPPAAVVAAMVSASTPEEVAATETPLVDSPASSNPAEAAAAFAALSSPSNDSSTTPKSQSVATTSTSPQETSAAELLLLDAALAELDEGTSLSLDTLADELAVEDSLAENGPLDANLEALL
ncbi:CotH kinase family protein [Aeoliella sp. ICT_H6.2]|uniref:CotH kinase family protein n=1 Tax=Aeoliella straminimaris TaxID=2954799 RepID=A0A9X2F9N1_9BACT|nr:CotH kinase family protein [Aeoliella straminimaris]MCO6044193.1 CotH kinase family protein [Aeoliella straminimaris]